MSYTVDRRTVLKSATAAGVATALAGCSGGGGGSEADARVGVLQPATGDLGNLGAPIQDAGALPGVQLADTDYEIDIRREDTETTPEVGIERAQALADAGYPSVTGAASSGVTIAVAEDVFFEEEVVGISPASTSPDITPMNGEYLLRTAPTDALQSQAAAQVGFEDEGLESASTMYVNNDYGQGLSDAFVSAYEDLGGEVLTTEAFEKEQSSYDSVLSSVLADDPDMLYVIGYPASGEQIFRNFYENYDSGSTTILVSDGLQDDALPGNVDNAMTNVLGTAPAAVGPGRDTFDQLFEDEYGSEPGVFTAQAYDATVVHILAQLQADELSGSAVSEQIRAVANPEGEVIEPDSLVDGLEMAANGDEIQYQGASSAVEFDENGDLRAATFDVFEFSEGGYDVTQQIDL
jgi:ABC-type branched-chain amino acid transport systems, periplasmic component